MRLHISQTTLLFNKYLLINLSLCMAKVSAMSLTPHILIHSAAISEVLTLKIFLTHYTTTMPSVHWRCWLGSIEGIRPVRTEWWGAGVVISLERGADLHMAQLMPLPLTVSCFSKIQIGFTFLVPAYPGCPGKRLLNWCSSISSSSIAALTVRLVGIDLLDLWIMFLFCLSYTHTHTCLMALCLRLPRWAGTRMVKPVWI